MFKKVQWKFFAFTASVLLAIFIFVLTSINIIMQTVMQRQSIVVLKQIASSIEYDDSTASFVYFEKPGPENGSPELPHEPEDNFKIPQNTDIITTAEITQTVTAEKKTSTQKNSNEKNNTQTPNVIEEPKDDTSPPKNEPNSADTENPVTTAVYTPKTETPTQPVQKTQPPAATKAIQQPETKAAATAPAKTEPDPGQNDDNRFPEKPWNDWNDPPPYEPDDRYPNDNNNNNTPDFENQDHWWGFNRDEFYQTQSNTIDAKYNGYTLQLSGKTDSPIKGYTVLDQKEPEKHKPQEAPVPKSLGSIDFFVIMADPSGEFLASLNNDDLTSDTAQDYIDNVLKKNSDKGMMDTYQFFSMEKQNGTIMIFTDKSGEINMLNQLLRTTIIIGIVSFICISILSLFISKKSIQPIKIAFDKQKQFISDASHELKTPLTIISANADVLAEEIGSNKWLEYIKSQTERMNILVNDLLNLTRLENKTSDFICNDFNLSKAIESTALPFECQAFEMHKKFEIDIQENLEINGSEQHIKQMAAIFIDNALKYSNEDGTVRITLKSQGDKKILSVYNTGSGIKDSEKDKIFERFYRIDNSRARTTGGYGLGLAIAKSIIDRHKFKISIDNIEGESICFNIIM